jgi:hypothetical protein
MSSRAQAYASAAGPSSYRHAARAGLSEHRDRHTALRNRARHCFDRQGQLQRLGRFPPRALHPNGQAIRRIVHDVVESLGRDWDPLGRALAEQSPPTWQPWTERPDVERRLGGRGQAEDEVTVVAFAPVAFAPVALELASTATKPSAGASSPSSSSSTIDSEYAPESAVSTCG